MGRGMSLSIYTFNFIVTFGILYCLKIFCAHPPLIKGGQLTVKLKGFSEGTIVAITTVIIRGGVGKHETFFANNFTGISGEMNGHGWWSWH